MGSVLSVFAPSAPAATRIGRERAGAESASAPAPDATATTVVSKTGNEPATPAPAKEQPKRKKRKQREPKVEVESDDEAAWPPDLCGLQDWGPDVDVQDWEGPQRLKETRLTAEEQRKFRILLDSIFSPETLMGVKIIFKPDDVMEVATKVIEYLKEEPVLIEDVPFGVTIVGDIHGQLHDLHRVFKADAKDGKPGWESTRYVFMGDYVDRGRQSIEVIMALYILKMLYPDRIFLLRGNHEFAAINMTYGLMHDFKERYDGKIADLLWDMFNESFMWLSLGAIVGNIYYCSHAGISPTGFTRRQLRGLYKPFRWSNEDILILDMTWSDPAQGLKGATFNKDRGSSVFLGYDQLCHALACLEVVAIFRGHTLIEAGYEVSWNVCVTIFTATDYNDGRNVGAVAIVNDTGKVGFRILDKDEDRFVWENMIRELEFEKPKEEEEKTVEKVLDDIGDGGPGHISHI